MRFLLSAFLLFAGACATTHSQDGEPARWRAQGERVTITRDDWGIAHVHGKSDADAVFGMIYAQAEDDFNRVETNYLTSLGRTAEAEGEKAIWADLRARLYMDSDDLRARYAASPPWLKRLMDSWADGLNYYLAKHPEVRPRAITRFEPWMALSFTEGSIGGDIERIDLAALEAFYTRPSSQQRPGSPGVKGGTAITPRGPSLRLGDGNDGEPRGSNGFAIAPSNSADGHALLLINPHTSFFFRSEQQVMSDDGLNAYGAATWGQFFIYQGFNDRAGWMHTSSGVDVVDEFLERVEQKEGKLFYRYGNEMRPVETKTVSVAYRQPDGSMASRTFETYRTHHGPVVRQEGGRWVAFAMMHKPVEALQQSFLRTKARNYDDFLKVAELKANSSNNTIFADAEGNIAYHHPHFIPVRDDRFDYTKPVDGSDPRTDWRGLHALSEAPRVLNPSNGWIQNTNNWPFSAAGANSPRQRDFPRYMDSWGENSRGVHAIQLLSREKRFTLEGLRRAAYDPYQPAFARLIPGLIRSWDGLPASDRLKARLAGPVAELRRWDYRWSADSVANTLAMFWGEALRSAAKAPDWDDGVWIDERLDRLPAARKLEALDAAVAKLDTDFGGWHTPWGEINRFQRLTGDIAHPFSDAGQSIPVAFSSARWGSLASFGAAPRNGSKRWYGTSGNSFVAVVEFGPRLRALAVTAGGESGHPGSLHFNDQAERYAKGDLREVYFYPEQLRGHTEKAYRPGQ
ncbi:MAG TPA: penicillin acylase family protein [Allosphingosinicella sp.]|jgi:acyl-homoserine-lactone acylase